MIDTSAAQSRLSIVARENVTEKTITLNFPNVVNLMDFYGQNNKSSTDQVYNNPAEWVDAIARGINSLRSATYIGAYYGTQIDIDYYLWS